jgi:hypothetical protein
MDILRNGDPMKNRHAEALHEHDDHAPVQRSAGRSSASERLPASGQVDPVQLMPGFAPVEHEDPFSAHLLDAVQLRGDGGESSERVHAAAAHGISGGGGALPFLDQIQASFGAQHDVAGIQSHVGGAAAEGAAAMGAQAFATGDHVAFAQAPDLHTAAHEAAHIVQQRSGVSLKGGVGETGDSYEQRSPTGS